MTMVVHGEYHTRLQKHKTVVFESVSRIFVEDQMYCSSKRPLCNNLIWYMKAQKPSLSII